MTESFRLAHTFAFILNDEMKNLSILKVCNED